MVGGCRRGGGRGHSWEGLALVVIALGLCSSLSSAAPLFPDWCRGGLRVFLIERQVFLGVLLRGSDWQDDRGGQVW